MRIEAEQKCVERDRQKAPNSAKQSHPISSQSQRMLHRWEISEVRISLGAHR